MGAQIVSVASPELVSVPLLPADHAPTFKSTPRLPYPAVWLHDPNPHWVTFGMVVDGRGSIACSEMEMEPQFRHSAGEELRSYQYRAFDFKPGTRNGKPVMAACYVTLVFNPAAVQTNAANAPVRIVSTQLPPSLPAQAGFDENFHYDMHVLVNPDGTTELKDLASFPLPASYPPSQRTAPDKPEVVGTVLATLRRWKFAPALENGHPVAREIHLGFWALNDARLNYAPPEIIGGPYVRYPEELRTYDNKGYVQIQCTVTPAGKVVDPLVLLSTHPAFEREAIASLLELRFKPATADGRPVAVQGRMPFSFDLATGHIGAFNSFLVGQSAYLLAGGSAGKHTGSLQYDVPPRPLVVVSPVYPLSALKAGTEGSATVGMVILPNGSVGKTWIIQASSPEFGRAAEAAALCWKFVPAKLHDLPTAASLSHEFSFSPGDRDFKLDSNGEAILQGLRHSQTFLRADELAHPPQSRYEVRPIYFPGSQPGQVQVEFYLDERGMVYFPHALSSTREDLILPVLTALARWQFTHPQREGERQFVRMQQTIEARASDLKPAS